MHGVEAEVNKVSTAPTPDKQPEIEIMCFGLAELRSRAVMLEDQARIVEVRLLGSLPAEDVPAVAAGAGVCLTEIVGADINAARDALNGLSNSLDRITRELGSIGRE